MLMCELYTDEYNTVIPDVGTEKNSFTYQISYGQCNVTKEGLATPQKNLI